MVRKDTIINSIITGHFDHSGLAEGVVDWQSLGTIQSLRVRIHGNCHHWIIMTEVVKRKNVSKLKML